MGARVDAAEQVQREKNRMKLDSVPNLQNCFLEELFWKQMHKKSRVLSSQAWVRQGAMPRSH